MNKNDIYDKSVLDNFATNDDGMGTLVYIDGSFNVNPRVHHNVGSGYYIRRNLGRNIDDFADAIRTRSVFGGRNVEGEVYAMLEAFKFCKQAKCPEPITIRYDYAGIENWTNGSWSARSELAKMYVRNLEKLGFYDTDVIFEHVSAHQGEVGNEYVDNLAKMACRNDYDSKIMCPMDYGDDYGVVYESITPAAQLVLIGDGRDLDVYSSYGVEPNIGSDLDREDASPEIGTKSDESEFQ